MRTILEQTRHNDHIQCEVRVFDHTIYNLKAFIGDNCSVNCNFRTDTWIPLMFCVTHMFNLSVILGVGADEDVSSALKFLYRSMSHMCTIEKTA